MVNAAVCFARRMTGMQEPGNGFEKRWAGMCSPGLGVTFTHHEAQAMPMPKLTDCLDRAGDRSGPDTVTIKRFFLSFCNAP
jgi:hypothetical protein